MSNTRKFSQFVAGGALVSGDKVVGLRNGANTYFDWSGTSGGGAGGSIEVTQAGHGFLVGQAVRLSGSTYVKAKADSAANAEAVGLVTIVQDADHFTVQQVGPVEGLAGLVAGDVYFLDPSSAGDLSLTEPSVGGQISKPMFIASSTTAGFILSMRGLYVAAAPVSPTEQINNILTKTISQGSHGLSQGNYVRLNAGNYAQAIATSMVNAEVVGQVISVIDANTFVLQTAGYISGTFSGLTVGALYYLSESSLGGQTVTEPSANGEISKPVFIADTATSGYILEQRGIEIGTGGGGGGSGDALTKTINQPGHGFIDPTDLGKLVRIDNTTGDFVFARADSFVNSLVVGMIVGIPDINNFVLQTAGYVADAPPVVSGLNVGELYYLDPVDLGKMTSTAPTTDGQVSRPVFMPDAADSGYLLEQRSLTLPLGTSSSGVGSGNVVQTTFDNNTGSNINFTGDFPAGTDVTITPSSSVSRIKITLNFTGGPISSTGKNYLLKRNGALIPLGAHNTPLGGLPGYYGSFIDSPSTTSAITYSLFSADLDGVAVASAILSKGTLIIMAEEIAAAGSGLARNVIQSVITSSAGVGGGGGDLTQSFATITPSSATSRIKVSFSGRVSGQYKLSLKRNGAILAVGGFAIGTGYTSTGSDPVANNFMYIDSPSTTLPVTYNIYSNSSFCTFTSGANSAPSFFILEEIGPA